jgi:hypothetical protein
MRSGVKNSVAARAPEHRVPISVDNADITERYTSDDNCRPCRRANLVPTSGRKR